MTSVIQVDASTGEHVVREMNDDELQEREALAQVEQAKAEQFGKLLETQLNKQVLLNTLLQVFVGYLGLHMQGKLPVVTFADFMGQVFEGYIQNGGKIDP